MLRNRQEWSLIGLIKIVEICLVSLWCCLSLVTSSVISIMLNTTLVASLEHSRRHLFTGTLVDPTDWSVNVSILGLINYRSLRSCFGDPAISLSHHNVFVRWLTKDLDRLLLLLNTPLFQIIPSYVEHSHSSILSTIVLAVLFVNLIEGLTTSFLLILLLLLQLQCLSIQHRIRLIKALISNIVIARCVFHHAIHRGISRESLFCLVFKHFPFLLLLSQLLLLLSSSPLGISILRWLILIDLAHQSR